ncbi:MAG TPA: ABC transporter ATP-binding protein [Bacteroidales bacterium]|nr:ABC transporter ATP-binding protein [Bacteroidales bacterium]HRZ50204.1 ABC transporter ATP-binding protein [Bacteroidales bacterium]
MLELKNISRHCRGFALENISLRIADGECCALMGRSGAGKTMLLRIIAGIDRHDTGSVLLDHKDISKATIQERNCLLMHQENTLFPHLSVMDNITFPLKARRMKPDFIRQRTHEMAKKMGISHLLSRKPRGLSGGESQRVALARALSVRPAILMLDEPLSSLDMELRDEMISILQALKQEGQSILMVTHQLEDTLALADKTAVLDAGKMVQYGTTDELIANPQSRFLARLTGIRNYYKVDFHQIKDYPLIYIASVQNTRVSFFVHGLNCPERGHLVIRENQISIAVNSDAINPGSNQFSGVITGIVRKGETTEITLRNGITMVASLLLSDIDLMDISIGDNAVFSIPDEAFRIIGSPGI